MLEDVIQNNTYPIVFIGSGMSIRYLEGYPNWEDLLEEYWEAVNLSGNMYSRMKEIQSNLTKEQFKQKEFYVNVKIAEEIEEKFNNDFFSEKITVENLEIKDAYKKGMSPFKTELSNRFNDYELKESMKKELELYKQFLSKARIIVTTNYDSFTEDLLQSMEVTPKIYVGSEGFFDDTTNWSELYKIHGNISNPDSIVFTEEDYSIYDENSILISAKILSHMINTPVIFLGYSLTDRNVQKLLIDFASQLPQDDLRKNSDRIIVVEYDETEREINEIINVNQELDISHLLVSTDNYGLLYDRLSKINQGLTPFEISRYEQAIHRIILTSGKTGDLDSYLISPENLSSLEEDIQHKRIVVALGDKKNIFINPNLVEYCEDYFMNQASFLSEVALPFIADEHPQARIPFIKYVKDIDIQTVDFLTDKQKEKIESRIQNMGKMESVKKTINNRNKCKVTELENIIADEVLREDRKLQMMTFNIEHFELEDIEQLITEVYLPKLKNLHFSSVNSLEKSEIRRLLLAVDIIKNGEV